MFKKNYTRQHATSIDSSSELYGGVLISLWLFLFAAQPKEFFLDGLKKLEQRSHKCVELGGEICKYIFSIPWVVVFFIKPKDL
jgi:hypothetical protein